MTTSRPVDVEVTLAGGMTYASVLESDSPILRDLYVALGSAQMFNQARPPFLVQLPLEGGRTACSFMSTSVIALRTTPPVLIDEPTLQPTAAQASTRPSLESTPDLYVEIQDFLTPDENAQLYQFTVASERDFEMSAVVGDAEGYRRSQVLYRVKTTKWRDTIVDRLKIHLPHIYYRLGLPAFKVDNFEIQLTASNEGDFFKIHADMAPDRRGVASRRLTYVYYFHRLPKPFSGGSLLLYRRWPTGTDYEAFKSIVKIEPRNNCLVAFASNTAHELEIVGCPSRKFGDSRFTINGWLHAG